jgi:hypothetical protein
MNNSINRKLKEIVNRQEKKKFRKQNAKDLNPEPQGRDSWKSTPPATLRRVGCVHRMLGWAGVPTSLMAGVLALWGPKALAFGIGQVSGQPDLSTS